MTPPPKRSIEDVLFETLRWPIIILCAFVGLYLGFNIGGVGGAIGAGVGYVLPALLEWVFPG